MLRYIFEQFMTRFFMIFAFVGFLGVLFYAIMTEIMLEEPGEVAPFVEQQDLNSTKIISLDKRHRTDREIEKWLDQVISEALTFNIKTYKENAKIILPYFTRDGFINYQEYLKNSGVFENLKDGRHQIGVFIDGQPLQLSGQAVDNVYRWLYQIPVTVSFLPNGTSDLRGREMISKKLSLRIQVKRVKLKDNPDAVQIESWVATARR